MQAKLGPLLIELSTNPFHANLRAAFNAGAVTSDALTETRAEAASALPHDTGAITIDPVLLPSGPVLETELARARVSVRRERAVWS